MRILRDLLLISLIDVSCQNSEGLCGFLPMAELTTVSHARHNHSNLPGPLGTAHLHIRPKDQAGDHAALVGCEPAHRKGDRPCGLSVLIGNSDCFKAAVGWDAARPCGFCRHGGGSCCYPWHFFGLMVFAAAAAAAAAAARTRG